MRCNDSIAVRFISVAKNTGIKGEFEQLWFERSLENRCNINNWGLQLKKMGQTRLFLHRCALEVQVLLMFFAIKSTR